MTAVKLSGVMACLMAKIPSLKAPAALSVTGCGGCRASSVLQRGHGSSAACRACNFPVVISKITYFRFL